MSNRILEVLTIVILFTSMQVYSGELSLSLVEKKKSILLGEPVLITVSLKNDGDNILIPDEVLNLEAGLLSIYIAYDDYTQYSSPVEVFLKTNFSKISMKHGSVLTKEIKLFYNQSPLVDLNSNPSRLAFYKEGVAKIKANLLLGDEIIESTSITVEISSPLNKDLFTQLNTYENIFFIHTGKAYKPYKKVDIEFFTNLMQLYPGSIYEPYVLDSIDKYLRVTNIRKNVSETPKAAVPKSEPSATKPKSQAQDAINIQSNSVDKPESVKTPVQKPEDNTLWYILAAIIAVLVVGVFLVKRRS